MASRDEREGSGPSLKDAFSGCFPVGASVCPRVLASHDELIRAQFNSLTCENHMKMGPIHPAEGEWRFEAADAVADYAAVRNMRLRGHTLLWHHEQGTPGWVFQEADGSPASRETVTARLREHILTLMRRYRGRIEGWDVVNEAVNPKDGEDPLRESAWRAALGETFIEQAFRIAHEADPGARLFYNDYGTFWPGKRQRIANLLRTLIDRGVAIHGVGMQLHYACTYDTEEVRRTLEAFAALGLDIEITELDVSIYAGDDERFASPPPERLDQQADVYGRLFDLFREYRQQITGVTFWNVADDRTWLDNHPVKGRKNWPLLFDEAHSPKPAFYRVIGGRGREWREAAGLCRKS